MSCWAAPAAQAPPAPALTPASCQQWRREPERMGEGEADGVWWQETRRPPKLRPANRKDGKERHQQTGIADVGEEGFEPSRPLGHTDLNRARLPFRHPPGQGDRLARPRATPRRRYDRMRAGTRRERG